MRQGSQAYEQLVDLEMHVVSSKHSGTVEHIHSFRFDSTTLEIFRQIRLSIAIVVLGWIVVTSIQTFRGA